MRGSRLPRHIAAFPLLFPLPARSGLWASLRHPVSRGFERASARRHRKRYVSHFPAYSHFSAFFVLFPEAAFLSPIVVGTFHAHSSGSATDSTTLHFAAPRVIHEWYNDVCPLMLALHALEGLLSGISGVRLGSVACKFVGRELQDCVDSCCPWVRRDASLCLVR